MRSHCPVSFFWLRWRVTNDVIPAYAPVVFESISVSVPELQGAVLAAPSPYPTKIEPADDGEANGEVNGEADGEVDATPKPAAAEQPPAEEEPTGPPPPDEQPPEDAPSERGDPSPVIPPLDPETVGADGEPEKVDDGVPDETTPAAADPPPDAPLEAEAEAAAADGGDDEPAPQSTDPLNEE